MPDTADVGPEGSFPNGHKPLLSTAQAAAFMNLMFVLGHNGDTVGRGRVIPHPHANAAPNTGHEQVAD